MAFTYLDSWEDAIAMLPEEQQAEARLAIITYGLKGEIMDGISPTSKAIVMLVKPAIDAEKEENKAPKRYSYKTSSSAASDVSSSSMLPMLYSLVLFSILARTLLRISMNSCACSLGSLSRISLSVY